MTALLDFPVSTDGPDPRDPLLVASVVRSLKVTELAVALHASGAKLSRALDLETVASLAEIGVAGIGLEAVRVSAERVKGFSRALVASLQVGLSGAEAGAALDRELGGRRRGVLCNDLAHRLSNHFGPKLPVSCDPS